MNIFDKFKKKPKSEELLKEELIAEMRAELAALSSYDRDDIFAVQERSESLDRLEDEMKLLNALKAEDLKKIDAKSETKKASFRRSSEQSQQSDLQLYSSSTKRTSA